LRGRQAAARSRPGDTTHRDRRRGDASMDEAIADLEDVPSGGRNNALNHAAWMLGRWNAAGALEQAEVEDALYAAAVANGLVADGWPSEPLRRQIPRKRQLCICPYEPDVNRRFAGSAERLSPKARAQRASRAAA
jgi:hypothetical protein